MRVDVTTAASGAHAQLLQAVPGSTVLVTGPPGSGKTSALAAYAAQLRADGREALIICSHASSQVAFSEAAEKLGITVAPKQLAQHAADWMRAAYLSARVSPRLRVGDATATRAIVGRAARGLLEMSWPMFAQRQFTLDLPHLGRPDSFLDAAATLFKLLQRSRISPEEFERGCAAGLATFYGQGVERALVHVQDPLVRERASQRGREACRASVDTLRQQREAERDLALVMAQLYREYVTATVAADARAPEDIIDAAIRWLGEDTESTDKIARRYAALIVDDAEDAEPGCTDIVTLLRERAQPIVILAGWDPARVDGLEGRRSALSFAADHAVRLELPPRAFPERRYQRLEDEDGEVQWLKREIGGLLADGVPANDIALLCRTSPLASHYARRLRDDGLPVSLPLSDLEDLPGMLDLLSLGAVIQHPFDSEHWLRVLKSPFVALNDAALWALCRDARVDAQLMLVANETAPSAAGAGGTTLAENVLRGSMDHALTAAQREKLATLRKHVQQWRADTSGRGGGDILQYLITVLQLPRRSAGDPEHVGKRKADDLQRLVDAVAMADTEQMRPASLSVAAHRLQEGTIGLRTARRNSETIASAAIVDAKGLRWPYVFVAGVAHERFPRIYTSHAMAFSRTYGLIVRENVARGAAQTAKFAWYYARFGAKAMYLDEERRALRYALGRASTAAAASGYGKPPRWARDHDLIAGLEAEQREPTT